MNPLEKYEPFVMVVAIFDQVENAKNTLAEIRKAAKQGDFQLENSVFLIKTADGKVKFHEDEDVSSKEGAIFGAIVGGVIGLLGGPVGVALGAAAGAATGGVAAGKLDMGFNDENLRNLSTAMKPGSSALLVVFDRSGSDEIDEIVTRNSAKVFRQMLTAEVADALRNEGGIQD